MVFYMYFFLNIPYKEKRRRLFSSWKRIHRIKIRELAEKQRIKQAKTYCKGVKKESSNRKRGEKKYSEKSKDKELRAKMNCQLIPKEQFKRSV